MDYSKDDLAISQSLLGILLIFEFQANVKPFGSGCAASTPEGIGPKCGSRILTNSQYRRIIRGAKGDAIIS